MCCHQESKVGIESVYVVALLDFRLRVSGMQKRGFSAKAVNTETVTLPSTFKLRGAFRLNP
jgi:hypothetical protein